MDIIDAGLDLGTETASPTNKAASKKLYNPLESSTKKDKPSVPNTKPIYTYNPKPGDMKYRSDPITERLIEKKVEQRERTKSKQAKEEWKRRYREVYG